MVTGTRQGLIGHDALVMPRVLYGHSGHGAFEGHGKEDVTSKVLDPPFTNLIQRSNSDEARETKRRWIRMRKRMLVG